MVKERLAPHTTRPAIANSPISLVRGESLARSSRNPMTKIPKEPKTMDPTTGFGTKSKWLICGTEKLAMPTTTKNENRMEAPPNLGVAC